jgi:hypothetical protein
MAANGPSAAWLWLEHARKDSAAANTDAETTRAGKSAERKNMKNNPMNWREAQRRELHGKLSRLDFSVPAGAEKHPRSEAMSHRHEERMLRRRITKSDFCSR